MGQRVITQWRVVVLYINLLAAPLPWRLNLGHDMSTSASLFEPITTLLCLILLVGLLILAACGLRRYRLIGFCILWFYVNLALESSILPLEMVFEHRLYLPMAGGALLASCLLGSLAAGRRPAWSVGIASAIILMLATATHLRNRHWQDELSLWSDVVAKSPHDHRARTDLGLALKSRDRPDEAIAQYRAALRLDPDYAVGHNNLATILDSRGLQEEAFHHYEQALRIDPRYAQAYNNMGISLASRGRLDAAIDRFRQAIAINPRYAKAHNNLAKALNSLGQVDKALVHFRAALRINSGFTEARTNLARLLERKKQPDRSN